MARFTIGIDEMGVFIAPAFIAVPFPAVFASSDVRFTPCRKEPSDFCILETCFATSVIALIPHATVVFQSLYQLFFVNIDANIIDCF